MEYFFLEDQLLIDVEDINLLKKYSWSISGAGYVQTSTRPSKFLHRLILKAKKYQYVDHINGNKLDNRKQNLRLCSQQQNTQNKNKTNSITSSKYKGVYFRKDRNYWEVKISKGNRTINKGGFKAEIEAAQYYDELAEILFGEFARFNFL